MAGFLWKAVAAVVLLLQVAWALKSEDDARSHLAPEYSTGAKIAIDQIQIDLSFSIRLLALDRLLLLKGNVRAGATLEVPSTREDLHRWSAALDAHLALLRRVVEADFDQYRIAYHNYVAMSYLLKASYKMVDDEIQYRQRDLIVIDVDVKQMPREPIRPQGIWSRMMSILTLGSSAKKRVVSRKHSMEIRQTPISTSRKIWNGIKSLFTFGLVSKYSKRISSAKRVSSRSKLEASSIYGRESVKPFLKFESAKHLLSIYFMVFQFSLPGVHFCDHRREGVLKTALESFGANYHGNHDLLADLNRLGIAPMSLAQMYCHLTAQPVGQGYKPNDASPMPQNLLEQVQEELRTESYSIMTLALLSLAEDWIVSEQCHTILGTWKDLPSIILEIHENLAQSLLTEHTTLQKIFEDRLRKMAPAAQFQILAEFHARLDVGSREVFERGAKWQPGRDKGLADVDSREQEPATDEEADRQMADMVASFSTRDASIASVSSDASSTDHDSSEAQVSSLFDVTFVARTFAMDLMVTRATFWIFRHVHSFLERHDTFRAWLEHAMEEYLKNLASGSAKLIVMEATPEARTLITHVLQATEVVIPSILIPPRPTNVVGTKDQLNLMYILNAVAPVLNKMYDFLNACMNVVKQLLRPVMPWLLWIKACFVYLWNIIVRFMYRNSHLIPKWNWLRSK